MMKVTFEVHDGRELASVLASSNETVVVSLNELPGAPTEPGWYWMRRKNPGPLDSKPMIVEVRDHGGDLVWNNTAFDGEWEYTCDWSEKIMEVDEWE
jgi:hypothetical protein